MLPGRSRFTILKQSCDGSTGSAKPRNGGSRNCWRRDIPRSRASTSARTTLGAMGVVALLMIAWLVNAGFFWPAPRRPVAKAAVRLTSGVQRPVQPPPEPEPQKPQPHKPQPQQPEPETRPSSRPQEESEAHK